MGRSTTNLMTHSRLRKGKGWALSPPKSPSRECGGRRWLVLLPTPDNDRFIIRSRRVPAGNCVGNDSIWRMLSADSTEKRGAANRRAT
jgi:hypothetical protein